jgi:uracil-DNA glycosylase family 4
VGRGTPGEAPGIIPLLLPGYDVPEGPALRALAREISACTRCPRLSAYLRDSRTRWPGHRGLPVPGWGDERPRLLIVGLAPGVHGANKTGRMFTWDSSGRWLYGALHRHGFASRPASDGPGDGLRLHGVWIGAAARCAPPLNRPTGAELRACRPYLESEYRRFDRLSAILALGRIAHEAVLAVLDLKPRMHPFGHGARHRMPDGRILVDSYHPSRQNTNTGRLTPAMWNAVFAACRKILDGDP